MLNFLLANKNCIAAFLNASNTSAPRMSAKPIHVKFISPSDAMRVPPMIINTANATFVCHLSRPVMYRMKKRTAGDNAFMICKNDSVK